MQQQEHISLEAFKNLVRKKYNIYNGMFLSLPFESIQKIGVMIPVMTDFFQAGLDQGLNPEELMDGFFATHTGISSENEKVDFLFKVIQYIERQIVLYDSVEDAAFPHLREDADKISIIDYFKLGEHSSVQSRLIKKMSSFSVRPVFTAHPTQFYPPAILDIISRLKSLVEKNDLIGIDTTLHQLGMTPMRKSQKPTPFEEAQNIIYYLRHVYYDAVGSCYSGIRETLPFQSFDNPGLVRIGFWPGGDRDGNPFVTAETTRMVADDLRMSLMKCYYGDIKELEIKLSFKEVDALIAGLRSKVYKSMFDQSYFLSFEEIIEPVLEIRKLLIERYNELYLRDLDKFIDKLNIFRTHFATLDIRQDHRVHREAIRLILKHNGIIQDGLDELSNEQLVNTLLKTDLLIDPEIFEDEVLKETILNIFQLKDIQHKNGEWGCNRYIISNSEDVFAVLFVFALFKWSAYPMHKLNFDIVPLFETIHGMSASAEVMQNLFDIPAYREHILRRGSRQTIMLGFSDGTKDGGYLKANWSIFRTKEELSSVCSKNNIEVVFFDGRGGPPARGGGKSYRFYAAQGDQIANHEIQLTIQGQTITSRYGTQEQFIHNCTQLLTAGLSREIDNEKICMDEASRILIDNLSDLSYQKYKELKSHPLFLAYLEHKTPLKYYNAANIGSRPAKRGKNKELEFSDLRAIPFVGSWSQMKQNVPGYFGLGTALERELDNGKLDSLKTLFRDVPFFKALILNSMMTLSKCNFALTRHMGKDPIYGDFWRLLYNEYLLTKEMVLTISGYEELMEEEKVSKNSINIREKIVLPLLIIQQFSMQQTAGESKMKNNYEKLITRSLYGIINASRNSI